ncbi:hypothetical protein STEG23_027881 [Scotinomys teguina]
MERSFMHIDRTKGPDTNEDTQPRQKHKQYSSYSFTDKISRKGGIQAKDSNFITWGIKFTEAKMGRRQCKSAYNIIKNKTTPESSPPPTPKSDYCNADKAEENDLKKSLMKMLEEAFEEKMKNVSKEIGENTNKKLEEINKEIEEKKSKKFEEMNNEIEEKKNKKLEEMNNEIEEKKTKEWKK